MRVFDAHRMIGPVPGDDVRSVDAGGVLAELDHLGIDGAAVTPSWEVFGDPAERGPGADEPLGRRLRLAPVALPAVAGAGWPDDVGVLVDANPVMVRTCPVRHRFDVAGATAVRWWSALADAGVPLALDAGECGLARVAAVADRVPELPILILSPGYRCLRELTELLDTYPRVFVETGTLVAAGAVEWLARYAGANRLVFGTGAPIWDDAGPRFQLDNLHLPPADVELIAGMSFALLRGGGPL